MEVEEFKTTIGNTFPEHMSDNLEADLSTHFKDINNASTMSNNSIAKRFVLPKLQKNGKNAQNSSYQSTPLMFSACQVEGKKHAQTAQSRLETPPEFQSSACRRFTHLQYCACE